MAIRNLDSLRPIGTPNKARVEDVFCDPVKERFDHIAPPDPVVGKNINHFNIRPVPVLCPRNIR